MLKTTVRPTGEEELDDYIKDLVEITIKMMVSVLQYGCQSIAVWVSEYCSMGIRVLQYGYQSIAVWVSVYYSMGVRVLQYGYQSITVWVSVCYSMGI